MGLAAEGFTVLAVLEARDMASSIYDKVQARMEKFSSAMKGAAESATESGAKIDESFMKTASGADALDVATARVEAAQEKLSVSTKAQAEAEKSLLEAQAQAKAAAEGDTEAMGRQVAASDKLTAATKETAKASAALKDAEATQAKITDAAAASTEKAAVVADKSGGKLGSLAAGVGKVGLGMAVVGGLMVKGAADFQSSTTVLQTSGGEVASQMGQVRRGILDLSGSTGTALKPLVDGMYMIGSAGYTGGAGLRVLQSASQGAKAENADLGTVSNALTTILKDYNVQVADNAKGQQASNAVMNQMIAVVQNGKTTTEQLAGSLSSVLPIASSVGLGFDQIGGAMATMTGQGMSAQQSAQDLNNVIGNLAGGNAVAAKEMQSLGLNANDVRKALGTPGQGLTGALNMVNDAIAKNFVGGAQVVKTFQSSASAAQNANTMIASMPASLQALAKSYMDNSVNAKQWKADLQGLDPVSAHLMKQFAGVADQTHAFNDQLLHGTPAQQSASQALSKMLGGTTGLNVALMLGANKGQTFAENVAKVKDAAKGAGANVEGWAQIQGNFNQKMAEAKQKVEVTGITIGTALLPAVTSLIDKIVAVITPIMKWIEKNQGLTKEIFLGVTAVTLLVGAINLGTKAFNAIKGAVDAVGSVIKGVGKLFTLFSGSTDAAAVSADGAAVSTDALAVSEDSLTVSTEASTVAADESAASWLAIGGTLAVTAIKFVALKVVQLAGAAATGIATAATWAFNAALLVATSPITLVVLALAALAAGVYEVVVHFSFFKKIAEDVFNWLKGAAGDTVDFVATVWRHIVGAVEVPIDAVVGAVQSAWRVIQQWFSDGVHAVESILSWFASLPGKFLGWLGDAASAVGRGSIAIVKWFIDLPGRVTSAIFGFFSGLGKTALGWVEGMATSIGTGIGSAVKWFIDLPGKVLSAIGDLSKTLVNAGVQLIKGFIDGIGSMFGSVESTLGNLASSLVSWKGPPSKDKILLTGNGQLVMQGFMSGIESQIPQIQAKLGGVTAMVHSTVSAGLPALPATSAVGAGPGGGTVVHIHLKDAFNGAMVMNDRDLDPLIAKIGGALARRILPSAGLRVAM